jgi:ATP-dependent RNA helicase DeaD
MLNMGFYEDIVNILSTTPDEKSTWLFSATMPAEVAVLVNNS